MRLNPPFGTFSKRCNSAIDYVDYNGNTFTLEKDKVVIIPVYSLHTDPDYFTNPKVFDPERFSEANGGPKVYKDKGVFLGKYIRRKKQPETLFVNVNRSFISKHLATVHVFVWVCVSLHFNPKRLSLKLYEISI